jgi:AraC-like DNA-binding protein
MDTKVLKFYDILEIEKKIQHPFSREVLVGRVKEQIAEGFAIWYDMGNGIAISVRDFTCKEDFLLEEESDVPGAVFIFNLGDEIDFVFKDHRKHVLKKENFLIGLASDKFCSKTPLQKGSICKTISIGIKEELFLQLTPAFKNIKKYITQTLKHTYAIFYDKSIDIEQFEALKGLKNKDAYEEALSSLYLESKALLLIHYTIKCIEKILNLSSSFLFDKNRLISLERAKEVITNEYDKNLSIKEIASKAATNECYLKKDFKEFYGMTILEMVQKKRLEKAKELLIQDLSVKEVAIKVGYKHVGYFNKLFHSCFGITPRLYRKNSLKV